jgi:hypothetical protein
MDKTFLGDNDKIPSSVFVRLNKNYGYIKPLFIKDAVLTIVRRFCRVTFPLKIVKNNSEVIK